MKKVFLFYIAILCFVVTNTIAKTVNTLPTYQEPEYKTLQGNDFDSYPLRYAKEISLTNREENSIWTHSGTREKYNILTSLTIDAYPGDVVTANFKANDSAKDTNGAEDLRWTVMLLYIDWDRDGVFESYEHIAGEYDKGSTTIYDVTKSIHIPDNTTPGPVRIRLNYTNAWLDNIEIKDYANITKEGIVYDFDINILSTPSRTITLTSDENGTATITSPTEGVTDNSITTDQPVTISATPNKGYMFVNWTNGDSEFSKENPYTYNDPEDITLRANFKTGSYPEMKRFFAGNTGQQNRYLEKVTYTVEGTENTIFEATTQENLPYNNIPSTATGSEDKATTEGAIIDKTATSIIIPEGSTSFDMKFKVWNKAINGNNQELVWTKQAYYIDFNNDFYFSGSTDNVNEISASTVSNTGDSNNFDDKSGSVENGWTRTINLPSTLAPGTYRMRVVYYEPGDANWNEILFTELNGVIRNGIAYDFNIEIISTERTVTVESNGGGNVSITSPAGVQGNSVTTKEEVTVSAEPNPGHEFVNWTNKDGGEEVSKNNTYTYSGSNDIILVANFESKKNRIFKTKKFALNSNNGFYASNGEMARGEISDKILGEWDETTDNRTNQLTISAWVNFSGADKGSSDWNKGSGRILMGHRQGHIEGYGSEPSFAISVLGERKMGVFSRQRASEGGYPNSLYPSDNQIIDIPEGWFHLALTAKQEGTNVIYNAYVNGEQTQADVTIEGNTYQNLPYLCDNQNGWGCVLCFGGNMDCKFDEVMVWTRALTQEEVKNSMKGFADSEIQAQNGLVGYYDCDNMEEDATSENLVIGNTHNLVLTGLTFNESNITSVTFTAKAPLASERIENEDVTAERSTPRGGDKFYDNDTEAEWNGNGDEEFGYIVNSETITHLDYNGYDKVKLPEGTVAVYHNGEPGLPVYVTADDYETVNGNTETTSSYVVSGLEYTVTMPAAKVWMPLSLPENVDLVYDNNEAVNLRPMWNFWYSTFDSEYTDDDSYSDIWNSFEKVEDETDSKTYELIQPGIISVPETRAGHSFTFYTKIDKPVVVRALNAEYNASLMPSEAGKIKFVTNPYSFSVNTSELVTSGMDIYRFNEASGNFDIVTEASDLNVYEPVMVFNNGGGAFKSPRYIGTKAVSGIIEYEAVYDVNVRGTEGAVEVETFIPADVEIFDTNGMAVAAGHVEGTHRFTLETGIYIVRTVVEGSTETFKVVVE